jgi:hypothetical protein
MGILTSRTIGRLLGNRCRTVEKLGNRTGLRISPGKNLGSSRRFFLVTNQARNRSSVAEDSWILDHTMRTDKIIYWTTTGIVCAVMTFSAINFSLSHPLAPGGMSFSHLGYPDYFKIELTIAKVLGVLALLIPGIPAEIREFAYFGFAITLVSATIAHFSCGKTKRAQRTEPAPMEVNSKPRVHGCR